MKAPVWSFAFPMSLLAIAMPVLSAQAASWNVIRVADGNRTFTVEQTKSELKFSSRHDTFSISIRDCNRDEVTALVSDIGDAWRSGIAFSDDQRRGFLSVIVDSKEIFVPRSFENGIFFSRLPESITRLWLVSRRHCGK